MPPKRVVEKARERPAKDAADSEDPDAHKNGDRRTGVEKVFGGVFNSFASRYFAEPYACTGKFQKDFVELCHKRGIAAPPQILPVPQPPVPTVIQHQQQEAKPEKGKKEKATAKEKEKVEVSAPVTEEVEEPKEPEFKTFAVRENPDFGRPTIFVEMENADKQETVTEMKIRGFKVDAIMLDIFQQCWPAIEKLSVVYFWNVGLNSETMDQLANALPACPNIKTLIVEGNPIPEENFYLLIEIENQVQNLLLRHNSIGDQGAGAIGHALGNPRRTNQRLLVLNLNGNVITDKGFVELIKGLRLNRTLLSLSVGGNFVGDEGAMKLAEVLSMFPLTPEEIVERRRLFSEQRSAERQKSWHATVDIEIEGVRFSDYLHERGENRRGDRPSSQTRSQSKEKGSRASSRKKPEGKGGKEEKEDHAGGKAKAGKKEKEEKEKAAARKGAAEKEKAQPAKAAPAVATTNKAKTKEKRGASAESQTPEKMDSLNPLLDDVEPRNVGELWIPGNRVLIMLNLANNRITKVGASALLKALQYQLTLVEFLKNGGTGLMRCNLQHNPIPEADDSYVKLQEHFLARDPLQRRRPPSVPSATPINTDPPGSLKSESRADGRRGRVSKE